MRNTCHFPYFERVGVNFMTMVHFGVFESFKPDNLFEVLKVLFLDRPKFRFF